jgi:hypothetical protein
MILRLTGLLTCALVAFGCVDREFISVDRQRPKRPIGDACTVDSECSSGRCIAGICDDGACRNDQDCRRDELCVFGACEPADTFACQPDQAPQLSLSPGLDINFGQVNIGQSRAQTVTVENTGDCLLTLSSVGIADDGDPGFSCSPCDPSSYPLRIPPFRSFDISVTFAPETAGDADSRLLIRGDDTTAGDRGLVSVALHGDYDGTPALDWSPLELNFGFVPFQAGGQQGERTLELFVRNRGTGNAALVIERVFVDEGLVFTIPAEINAIRPDSPALLAPYDPNDASTELVIPVTFRPNSTRAFDDRLVIRLQDGTTAEVPITGDSRGPPQISVSTDALEFRCRGGPLDPCPAPDPYPVGLIAFRQFTITNSGASPLEVSISVGGASQSGRDDFSVSPSFIPPIQPGGAAPFTVFFNPSQTWDPATAFVNIISNDTDPSTDVLKTIALTGYSQAAQNDQVLKLEMEYQNGDNSWAGNDFRNVDLELESPTGFTCAKPRMQYTPDGNGGFIPSIAQDYCAEWRSFGQEGQVNWIALGAFEEPERIILFGLGPTGAEGGTFRARVYYVEDCANIPTGLLANILGIGGSILLGVLGGAVGVPIVVPPDQISQTIANNCFDHDSSLTTLHISLNGVERAAPQVRLDRKGDVREIARLVRRQGQFCDPQVGIPCP